MMEGRRAPSQSAVRSQSAKRGSTAFTWSQLALRRTSTNVSSFSDHDNNSADNAANGDDDDVRRRRRGGDGEAAVARKPSPLGECLGRAGDWVSGRCQSLSRSLRKASKHPKTIILPSVIVVVVLCTAGLFAVHHSAQRYHESQSLALLEETRELAYELDDVLSGALLPLFTLQEMAGQIDEFRDLRPLVLRETSGPRVESGGRSFRNVTEVCTDPGVAGLYRRAAESIVESSKMGSVLLNVQLQPAGTVCLNHPDLTTYPDGTTMDHTKAIGLDTIHDMYQRETSRASIDKGTVSTSNPFVLVQDTAPMPHETLIFWTPVFVEGFDLTTLDDGDGERRTYEGFWGFAGVLLDWDEVLASVGLHDFFGERNMRFALVDAGGDGSDDEVIESSIGDEPPLTREEAREALLLQTMENWELLVAVPPPRANDPAWAIWGSVLVILGSFVIALALMVVLVKRKDHEELLCRCIPRNIVRRIHMGETVIEKYDVATICFIDIVSFTTMSGRMKAHEVMDMLQVLFREFDKLTERYNCFNAETIGDAYITVSGGPEGSDAATGAANIAAFALGAVDVVRKLEFKDGNKIKIRVGVASGPVVAGVIGTANVPKFTLFGQTTSLAEEMEKTSLPLQVQCSEETMKLLRSNFKTDNSFHCKHRKEGNENTWWIIRPSEANGTNGINSNEVDDIGPALAPTKDEVSTVDSTTVVQSEPRRRSVTFSEPRRSTGTSLTDENEKHMLKTYAAAQDADCAQSAKSTISSASGRATFELENYLMSDNNTWQKNEEANSSKTCCIPIRGLGRMFSVAASNRRILLSTFLTFAILCGFGLATLYIFANEYEKDKYQFATELAEAADRWLEKEIAKSLLPLFAMSELVKVVGKWDNLPAGIEGTQQYNKGTSVFNNVSGLCDDPAYRDPFVDIASSIKQSSGLQKILVNVQLAPIGVLCLTYPKNNTEDFPPGVFLDTSGAIGLNLFDTPNRAASSKAAVFKEGKTIQGPIKLAQGNLSVVDEAIIARYPVFTDTHNMVIDGQSYPFWGLTIVLMDWDKLKSKFGIYNFFSRAGMQFRMTRYDGWGCACDKVIANSTNHEILDVAAHSISFDLETSDDTWTLIVGYEEGFTPPWLGWGTACVVIGSMLLSILVMMVLAVSKMNKMLLYRMMPREAILAVEQGKTFVERDSEATIFFSHLIGFEKMSGEMGPKDFLLMLTQLYTEFDKLAVKHQCCKIETIGAYYIVNGPGPSLCGTDEREGVARIALFALDAIELVKNYQYKGVQLQIRAGFATGPVVSGVIGSGGLPKFTVFGDTVNFASRMESTSRPMSIQCPHKTYKLLRNSSELAFDLDEREADGELGVYVKGKGQTMTYWLKGYTAKKGSDDSEDIISSNRDQCASKGDNSAVNKEAGSRAMRDLENALGDTVVVNNRADGFVERDADAVDVSEQ